MKEGGERSEYRGGTAFCPLHLGGSQVSAYAWPRGPTTAPHPPDPHVNHKQKEVLSYFLSRSSGKYTAPSLCGRSL